MTQWLHKMIFPDLSPWSETRSRTTEGPGVLTLDSASPFGSGAGLPQVVACPDLSQQVVDDAALIWSVRVSPD